VADTPTIPKAPDRYVAVVLMGSSADAADYEPLYEECFLLVHARSADEAAARGERLGREQETSYRNDVGETITWRLLRVVDVSPVLSDELEDGSTLYARHFRDYESYRRFEPLMSAEE
jgi:hypothetical protein